MLLKKTALPLAIFALFLTGCAQNISKTPEKIATVDYGALDTLIALGAQNKVVALPNKGMPSYIQEQMQNSNLVDAGGLKEPNIENLQQTNPDLIIVTGRQTASFDQLEQIAPLLNYSADANRYWPSVKENIFKLGQRVATAEEVEQAWSTLQNDIHQTQASIQANPLKTLVLLHNDGKLIAASYAAYGQFIHNVLQAPQAAAQFKEPRTALTLEQIKNINPEVIFIIDRSAAIGAEPMDIKLFEQPELAKVKAIESQRIVYLTPDLWYLSGNGLQSLSLQAKEVEQAFN